MVKIGQIRSDDTKALIGVESTPTASRSPMLPHRRNGTGVAGKWAKDSGKIGILRSEESKALLNASGTSDSSDGESAIADTLCRAGRSGQRWKLATSRSVDVPAQRGVRMRISRPTADGMANRQLAGVMGPAAGGGGPAHLMRSVRGAVAASTANKYAKNSRMTSASKILNRAKTGKYAYLLRQKISVITCQRVPLGPLWKFILLFESLGDLNIQTASSSSRHKHV